MINLIISILVAIIVYLILDIHILKEGVDYTKAEKCFYDFELIQLHDTFVSALKQNPDILRKMKGKLLPGVCILDLVMNKKNGWDKFLDSQANRFGTNRKFALLRYLTEVYDKAIAYTKEAGIEYLTQPYTFTIETIDTQTGQKVSTQKTMEIMKEFNMIMAKKVLLADI